MLDLSRCDELALAELREHDTVKVMDDGTVAVPSKLAKGFTIDPTYGLGCLTQEAVGKANPPGLYKVPTADEWQRESAIRATPNPWRKSSWNLTAQLTMADQDPELAARFQREANA